MTLVPPADAAIGADAPLAPAEPLNEPAGDDVPVEVAPAPAPAVDTTLPVANLVITSPWQTSTFESGVDGWDPITPAGVSGPAATADQVIAAGAASGVTIESR